MQWVGGGGDKMWSAPCHANTNLGGIKIFDSFWGWFLSILGLLRGEIRGYFLPLIRRYRELVVNLRGHGLRLGVQGVTGAHVVWAANSESLISSVPPLTASGGREGRSLDEGDRDTGGRHRGRAVGGGWGPGGCRGRGQGVVGIPPLVGYFPATFPFSQHTFNYLIFTSSSPSIANLFGLCLN